MNSDKNIPSVPSLTPENSLKTLIENRTVYNLESCELNLFETYEKSAQVPLKFNDLVVTTMLKGKKVMHLLDKQGFDYLPGESVIVPSNTEMKIDFPEASMNNPTQCLALAIDDKKIADTLNFLNEKYPREETKSQWQLNRQNFFFQNNEEMASIINRMILLCQSTNLFKDTLADLSLQELLVKIVQLQTLKEVNEGDSKTFNQYLHQVVSIIRVNLSNKVELKTIANKAGMSTSALYRLFKNELGMSPIEFILLERIKLAKHYLTDKKIFIKNVSFETGFQDTNYFIRVFKQYEGITPKQYQQLLHKE